MEFRIAQTFTDSLTKLTGDEQKAVKTTAFDLQVNPASPSMKFHRLDKSKDKNFWSIRVSGDIRMIVHKTSSDFLLCYVDHHDRAYDWAERRKLETHPKTGAAQLVEIRERVKDIIVPNYVEVEQPAPPKPPLFESVSNDELLSYGVPEEWLDDVKALVDEDALLELADHLPAEAAEALLNLATGQKPKPVQPVSKDANPFEHPDAKRSFSEVKDSEELERAFKFPWEKWIIFLHPSQRQTIEKDYSGPARAAGSAGTGKTIVALHRAVVLAKRNPDARVLLTTFSGTLADSVRLKLRYLISSDPRLAERLEVHSIQAVSHRIAESIWGKSSIATDAELKEIISDSTEGVTKSRFTQKFLRDEWIHVVDAWQINSWEQYRDVQRLGRKTRLAETQRKILWEIYDVVRRKLEEKKLTTEAALFTRLAEHLKGADHSPYDHVVVDEAQDLSVSQLRFLAAMGKANNNSLFFSGDLGQRIFQPPFSWKSLGVDVRGRSNTLRINYRTSHQIRQQADRLLPPELTDVDGNTEDRRGTVSVFNGPQPILSIYRTADEETEAVGEWIKGLIKEGFEPREIGVFVRSEKELGRAQNAVAKAGVESISLTKMKDTKSGHVTVSNMHLAKGLEFRAVAVMACDDEILPLQERIESVSDSSDLEDVYNTERHLLYVACTRARERLFVTATDPASEFLDDLKL